MNHWQEYDGKGKGKGHPVVPEPSAAWWLLASVLFVVVFKLLGKKNT